MRLRAFVSSFALAGASVALVAPVAHADGCTGQGYGYTNSTYSVSYSPGCNTQARIDRYYGGVVHQYYGSWGSTSYVYNANGYNAGNYFRLGPSAWMRI